MARTRKLTVEIAGDTSGVRRAFGQVEESSGRLGRKMTGLATVIGGAFAVDQVVEFGASLVRAAEDSQKVASQTEAVLKSMGGAANVTADQVADLSEALSVKAGIDDELIQSGANVLLTFGKIRNEIGKGNNIYDRATAAALDMSVALKTDLNSAAIQVGKALNDPVRGLTALRRAGIQFTKQQEDQIKVMVEAGDVLGAQKIMVEELERQFGGSAAAQATATGKLAVAWDNLKEKLGERLLPVIEKVALWLADNLPGAADRTVAAIDRISAWCRNNIGLLQTLGVLVGVTLTAAFLSWAASAAAAAAATIAATWPVLAAVAAVVGLTVATQKLIEKFRGPLNTAMQAVVDVGAGLLHFLSGVLGVIKQIAHWAKVAADALGRIKVPSLGGGGGLLPFLGPFDPSAGLPLVPFLDDGGVMPGQSGVHSLAWVAGGETVLPTHKPGFSLNSGPQVIQLAVDGRVLAEVVADHQALQSRNRAL